jgi:hypothetical protein
MNLRLWVAELVCIAYLRFMIPGRPRLSKDLVVRFDMISLLKFNVRNHPYIELLAVDSCIVHWH